MGSDEPLQNNEKGYYLVNIQQLAMF